MASPELRTERGEKVHRVESQRIRLAGLVRSSGRMTSDELRGLDLTKAM